MRNSALEDWDKGWVLAFQKWTILKLMNMENQEGRARQGLFYPKLLAQLQHGHRNRTHDQFWWSSMKPDRNLQEDWLAPVPLALLTDPGFFKSSPGERREPVLNASSQPGTMLVSTPISSQFILPSPWESHFYWWGNRIYNKIAC